MTDPTRNLEQFGLQPGLIVADCGAGSGFYAVAAARLVGGAGRIFAIDVQQEMLEKLKRTAKEEGLDNLEVIWGDIERENGTRLRSGSVDRALVTNTLFQTEDKPGLAREVFRILGPGGGLLVVDWTDSHGGMGPAPEHIVTREQALELFELVGFDHQRDISAGEHHYGFVMNKAGETEEAE